MSTAGVVDSGPAGTVGASALRLPDRSVVVLAGLPGAGKTTLLRRLTGTPGVRALDSEDVTASLRRLELPYRLLRPLVHALHLLRVAVVVHEGVPSVLTTDPFTSPIRRRLLRTVARLSRRSLYVVLIDASPDEARDGRLRRGRDLPAARGARHERRCRGLSSSSQVQRRLSRAQAAGAVAVVDPRQARPSAVLTSGTRGAAWTRPGLDGAQASGSPPWPRC